MLLQRPDLYPAVYKNTVNKKRGCLFGGDSLFNAYLKSG